MFAGIPASRNQSSIRQIECWSVSPTLGISKLPHEGVTATLVHPFTDRSQHFGPRFELLGRLFPSGRCLILLSFPN